VSFDSNRTFLDLEVPALLAALSSHCLTPMGKALALAPEFLTDVQAIKAKLALSSEACALLDKGDALPMRACQDVSEALARLGAGAALSKIELRDTILILAVGRTLRRFFSQRKESTRLLAKQLSTDPSLDDAEDAIRQAFDSDGLLRDDASPKLAELRAELKVSRSRILGRLEEVMKRYAHTLTDAFVTEREGRFVLPVRADSHERFTGILHATSASGATLFIEPRSIVQLGNRLKVLEGDAEREEIAICMALSQKLSHKLESVVAAVAIVAEADALCAVARLASALRLRFPTLSEGETAALELKDARHPLLALQDAEVVPSDIALKGGEVLVISGPNAGGKTVALKTVGLCALMIRAGMPIPCAETSTIGIFPRILTDIGDGQNIGSNLSTFSAHMQRIAGILQASREGTLVLVDELAGGTDPREGEALAAAVLSELARRGAAAIVTTHYEGLKALAFSDPRFLNTSVGFDERTLAPTFRLVPNVPGPSSALAVAKRFGIDDRVIEQAKTFLSAEVLEVDALVSKLHRQQAALTLAHAAALTKAEEAEEAKQFYARELARLTERGERAASKEVEALYVKAEKIKGDIETLSKRLAAARAAPSGDLKELAKDAETLSKDLRKERASEQYPSLAIMPSKGASVYVRSLEKRGEIIEVLSPKSARVQIGILKLVADLADLAQLSTAGKQGPSPSKDNTCDVRALVADDAVREAMHFIDRAITSKVRTVFIVHGPGKDPRAERIRKALRNSPYVASFKPAELHDGGEGTTVVWMS
jgi:DNA mismatch repair protein MutS2